MLLLLNWRRHVLVHRAPPPSIKKKSHERLPTNAPSVSVLLQQLCSRFGVFAPSLLSEALLSARCPLHYLQLARAAVCGGAGRWTAYDQVGDKCGGGCQGSRKSPTVYICTSCIGCSGSGKAPNSKQTLHDSIMGAACCRTWHRLFTVFSSTQRARPTSSTRHTEHLQHEVEVGFVKSRTMHQISALPVHFLPVVQFSTVCIASSALTI